MKAAGPSQPGAPARPVLDPAAFAQISAIAYREAGLAIAPGKAAMVHTRLARRLRALALTSYQDYCALIASDAGAGERREMISALTTNVSHFFREAHHFDRLRDEIAPGLHARLKAGGRVRIWSAGCSNGQEPYSIAMTLLAGGEIGAGADLRVLATDIDPKVIAFARRGLYDERMMAGLPADLRTRFFARAADGDGWLVSDRLKGLVRFRELNLLDPWPMRGRFDVIFCRNVVIYFDTPTQEKLWRGFAEVLNPQGWLFLGHSERLSDDGGALFAGMGLTAYRRTGSPALAI